MKFILVFFLTLLTLPTYAHQEQVASTQPTIVAEIVGAPVLKAKERNDLRLKLTNKESGQPVTPDDLKTVHTEKVHLLIIDPSLTDYHHIHPQPTQTPGEYRFSITPNLPYHYRLWVDIVPKGAQQAYVIVDLPGKEACPNNPCHQPLLQVVADDGELASTMDIAHGHLRAGQHSHATVSITKDGQPFTALEPVMGAYAHLVGFYDDFETIAHVHPMGEKPQSPQDRAGPTIQFHLMPDKAGYLRLFNQVQIDGENRFAMFGVEVQE